MSYHIKYVNTNNTKSRMQRFFISKLIECPSHTRRKNHLLQHNYVHAGNTATYWHILKLHCTSQKLTAFSGEGREGWWSTFKLKHEHSEKIKAYQTAAAIL